MSTKKSSSQKSKSTTPCKPERENSKHSHLASETKKDGRADAFKQILPVRKLGAFKIPKKSDCNSGYTNSKLAVSGDALSSPERTDNAPESSKNDNKAVPDKEDRLKPDKADCLRQNFCENITTQEDNTADAARTYAKRRGHSAACNKDITKAADEHSVASTQPAAIGTPHRQGTSVTNNTGNKAAPVSEQKLGQAENLISKSIPSNGSSTKVATDNLHKSRTKGHNSIDSSKTDTGDRDYGLSTDKLSSSTSSDIKETNLEVMKPFYLCIVFLFDIT